MKQKDSAYNKHQQQHPKQLETKTNMRQQKRPTRAARENLKRRPMSSDEISSWRRVARNQNRNDMTQQTRAIVCACFATIIMLQVAAVLSAREISQLTFVQSQHHLHQQQIQTTSAIQERCKSGAPLQWRPYLDAASKAYLAPVVAIASLEHYILSPIQLMAGAGSARASKSATASGEARLQPQLLIQHAQSVNNVGVLIEASFQIRNLLRRSVKKAAELQVGSQLSLHYRVSASLATTSDIISLANSMEQSPGSFGAGNKTRSSLRLSSSPLARAHCVLELTESELTKKGGDLFKVGRNYVLFLEPATSTGRKAFTVSRHQPHQAQQVASVPDFWAPFASHEPASNQTSRSVNRVLCKNCVRPPTVRLVNSTLVSIATQQQQQQPQTDPRATARRRVKLDCRVLGNPTPWVEWYRNGKLLRNKPGKTKIRTTPWKGRPNERLSRLELELVAGRNETGVYECRAMNVAAREPTVGTYTLVVSPAKFALYTMQQVGAAAGSTESGELEKRRKTDKAETSATITSKHQSDSHQPASASNQMDSGTKPMSGGESSASTSTLAPAQQQDGASKGQHGPDEAGRLKDGANSGGASGTQPKQQQPTKQPRSQQQTQSQQQADSSATSKSPPVVVGQPCPGEEKENFCLNRGTCVLIGHIEEYFCNCAEGYHGHRCEFKSLGHQQNSH